MGRIGSKEALTQALKDDTTAVRRYTHNLRLSRQNLCIDQNKSKTSLLRLELLIFCYSNKPFFREYIIAKQFTIFKVPWRQILQWFLKIKIKNTDISFLLKFFFING